MSERDFFIYWILWICNAVSFGVGYFFGRKVTVGISMKEMVDTVKKTLHPVPSGSVSRPTAKQLYQWKHPKEQQAEEAMIDTLKEFPELKP